MIVRTLGEARATPRKVVAETWESTRLVLRDDAVGFSFHITTMRAGTSTTMWYRNHFEAVYCISGTGEIQDERTGSTYLIEPGTIYVLDKHDRHTLVVKTEMELACVFNPPVTGRETHDETGAYPSEAEMTQVPA